LRPISRNIGTLLLRLGVTAPPFPEIGPELATSGSLSMSPEAATAGAWGTWTLRYEVGEEPIEELGGLRVQLPEVFHAGIRNSAFRTQASAPREPNFVAAHTSVRGVVLQTFIELESDAAIDKAGRWSNLSGRGGYYNYVARVIVRRGRLAAGDVLTVLYGDTSGGSRGFRAGINRCAPSRVFVAVDHDGLGRFRLHRDAPTLAIVPGEPADLFAVAPSDAVVGEPFALRIALVDEHGNPAPGPGATRLRVTVMDGEADLPPAVKLPAGEAWTEVRCTPRAAGVLRLQVDEPERRLAIVTNPARVHAEAPATRILWGDLHSHTEVSNDGVGTGRDAYEYARHVAALDFYSRSDHNSFFEAGNPVADFGEYVRLADEWNEPGRFATIHGVEVSFGAPYGHHNVYFRGDPTQVADEYASTLPELWKALAGMDALTIPHHTMKMPSPIDWSDGDDPERRRNFEIFSAHGLSEEYDPYHPLAIEQSLFTNASTTQRNGMSAQRAWEDGLQLSSIASSDDHRAQPGLPHHGLVAVRADALTREAVFDALRERRTYATTGVRVLLDFTVGGVAMGSRGPGPGAGRALAIEASAVGTDLIDLVEVVRHVAGRPGFAVIAELRPRAERFEWTFEDDLGAGAGPAIYYLRLRQRGLVRGSVAMAWSSPVWIEPSAGD
jgi:hypothetical protein